MKKTFLISMLAVLFSVTAFSQVASVTLDETYLCEGYVPAARGSLSNYTATDWQFQWEALSGGGYTHIGTYPDYATSFMYGSYVTSGYFYYRVRAKAEYSGTWSPWSSWTYGYIYPVPDAPSRPSGSSEGETYGSSWYSTTTGHYDYDWSVTGGSYSITDYGYQCVVTFTSTGTFKIKVRAKEDNSCGWGDYSSEKTVTVDY
jgi:hypothetical protein